MDVMLIIKAVGALAGTGLVLGFMLGFAAKTFHVEVDPRVEKITELLPGANCGACGHPGCEAAAMAVVAGGADAHVCTAGGHEVAGQIADILGITVGQGPEPQIAFVSCGGGRNSVSHRYEYVGPQDCDAAGLIAGGPLSCTYGCLGFGNCVDSCAFDALHLDEDGLPKVDIEKCTGCGLCVSACPRGIMKMVPANAPVMVACNSKDRGKVVRENCKTGCIACKRCERVCEPEAIKVVSELAVIDYEKCNGCMKCIEECPTNCIVKSGTRVEVLA